MTSESKYRLRVLRRFKAHIGVNEDHVCGSILAGPDWEHLTLAGTLTMTEEEWATLSGLLKEHLGTNVELEDGAKAS